MLRQVLRKRLHKDERIALLFWTRDKPGFEDFITEEESLLLLFWECKVVPFFMKMFVKKGHFYKGITALCYNLRIVLNRLLQLRFFL